MDVALALLSSALGAAWIVSAVPGVSLSLGAVALVALVGGGDVLAYLTFCVGTAVCGVALISGG